MKVKVTQSCPTLCNPKDLYSPWNSPGQNTAVSSLSLLQGIFPTQESNPSLLHCRWILYQLNRKGSPRILEWVAYPFSRGSSWPRNQTRVSYIAGRFFTNWPIREVCSDLRGGKKQKTRRYYEYETEKNKPASVLNLFFCALLPELTPQLLWKNVAHSLKYTVHFQGSDLQSYNTFPFRIEIKSCRTLVLLVVHNSTVTRPMWTTARAKNYDTEKFATTSHTPSPFRIKAAWILTWVRWFFGTRVHHLLNLLTFLIKLLFLVPEHCSLMYWPVEWWAVQLELANKHGLSLVVESVGTVFLSIIILLKKGSTFNLNVLVHI